MLPPEIMKSGLMTSLVTTVFPESEEKQYGKVKLGIQRAKKLTIVVTTPVRHVCRIAFDKKENRILGVKICICIKKKESRTLSMYAQTEEAQLLK